MTRRSTDFRLQGASGRPSNWLPRRPGGVPVPRPSRQKINVRKAVNDRSGGRGAGRRGLVWLRLLDRRPVSGLDRRRLCEGRQHHDRAEGLRLSPRGAGRRQRTRQGAARCWRGSTTATSRSRSTRPRPTSPPREAAIASKQAQLDVQQAVIDAAKATHRRRHGERDLRHPGEQALHRSGRHRLRQRAERAAGAVAQSPARRPRSSATPPTLPPPESRSICSRPRSPRPSRRWRAPTRCSARPNSISATPRSSRRSTASSATARCAPASIVQAGTQLMSVVPVAGAYVVANFKETQLTDVQEGQAVDIAVDMFPGKVVHGHVDSIAPASGQEFALLPPDNATGNFTKVVQRIPVKIALDARQSLDRAASGHVGDPDHRDASSPASASAPRSARVQRGAARSQNVQERCRRCPKVTSCQPRSRRFPPAPRRDLPSQYAGRSRTAPASRSGSPCSPP